MALYLADHNVNLAEALAIAQRERAARADIFTCDVLAWCYFKNGNLPQAKTALDEALRLGTRDARLFYHAGMIYRALGDEAQAATYLQRALALHPHFDVLQAESAKEVLAALRK
ncbi:MAG: tetratricopeptide repeat protein [Blastocatellia bacterium]